MKPGAEGCGRFFWSRQEFAAWPGSFNSHNLGNFQGSTTTLTLAIGCHWPHCPSAHTGMSTAGYGCGSCGLAMLYVVIIFIQGNMYLVRRVECQPQLPYSLGIGQPSPGLRKWVRTILNDFSPTAVLRKLLKNRFQLQELGATDGHIACRKCIRLMDVKGRRFHDS